MDGWGSLSRSERLEKLKTKTNTSHNEDEFILKVVDLTFEAAAQVYAEYQHSHNPGLPFIGDPKDFIWDFSFNRGGYHFYVLDMRGHHDCERGPDECRLLSMAQHERLEAWLDTLEGADGAFILSSVPVVHWSPIVEYSLYFVNSLKDDLMDAWAHPTNHIERDRLFRMLFKASEKHRVPITIVSGDVHCASVYTLSDEGYPNAKVLQVNSSPISRKPVPAIATKAFARTGFINRKENDGKGKDVRTTVHQRQCFAKAGICNFAIIKAEGKELKVTFYYTSNTTHERKTVEVDLVW